MTRSAIPPRGMFRPLTGRVAHGDEDEPANFRNPRVLVAVIAHSLGRELRSRHEQ